ncbi:MAG TPA: SpoIVB peptidase [Defluviitaleaceae bacterium]|nr:SpoIVB peptidase [Defluviitaleaceae bacterium]
MNNKKFLRFAVLFVIFVLLISPYAASYYYIPKEIKMMAGRNHDFEFNLPLQAKISSEKIGVLKFNNKPIESNNFQIDLRSPFSVQPTEQATLDVKLKFLGIVPLKTVKVDIISQKELVPCGMTVGVNVSTDGIMVLGTGTVISEDGKEYTPSRGILKTGDLILKVNEKSIENKEELISAIENSNGKVLKMTIKRDNELLEIYVTPIKSEIDKSYKIGAWVRDETQGIGTITYYNPKSYTFGALGHGITDIDTRKIIPIKNGKIMKAEITSIKKGRRGIPGELTGAIYDTEEAQLGTIELNTSQGIFGKLDPKKMKAFPKKSFPIAFQNEIHEGKAIILSNISGDKIEEFEIVIQKVSRFQQDISKGMIIKITDPRLLDKTNGIIQGMSGSPIIQDEKLVGAVTHVFVHDPTKGYGIFIENMLKNESDLE